MRWPSLLQTALVRAEILRALTLVLPCVKDTYETFWDDLLETIPSLWNLMQDMSSEAIPLTYASLKNLTTLQRLSAKNSNDDLQEAWRNNQESIGNGLISLSLRLQGERSANSHLGLSNNSSQGLQMKTINLFA